MLAAVPARAGVVVHAGVPFTSAQLHDAIAARRGSDGGDLDVEVSRLSPTWLVLIMPTGRWEIQIDGVSGEMAARIVALHVVELADGPLAAGEAKAAPMVPPALDPAASVRDPAAPAAKVHVRGTGRAKRGYRVAALGVGSRGVRADDFVSVGGAVRVTRTGRWVADGGIAWERGLTIEHEPALPISTNLIRARAAGGVAFGPLELVAGGFAGRVHVDAGTDMIREWAVGLAAEGRVAAHVSGALSIMLAASAEVSRNRVEVRFDDVRVGATPRVALGGGIGLAWTGGQRW